MTQQLECSHLVQVKKDLAAKYERLAMHASSIGKKKQFLHRAKRHRQLAIKLESC